MKHGRTGARLTAIGLACAAWAWAPQASAMGLSAGNLVAYRVETGSTALAVYLDEYRPDGSFVQSIALHDPAFPFSASSTGSEGLLNRSADRSCLVVPGYAATPGDADPKAAANRAALFVDAAGMVGRGTSLGTAFLTDALRGAASSDCNQVWASGNGSGSTRGIWYAPRGASSATRLNSTNTQGITIAGDQLYAAFAGGGTVNTIGTGLPTSGTPATQALPGLAGRNHRGIAFLDLDGVPGVDTLYLAVNNDDVVRKYVLQAGTWVDRGSVPLPGAHGLVAADTGDGQVMLLATPEKGKLFRVFDRSGFGGTLSGTPQELATAAAGSSFYGLAWAPEASPPTSVPAAPANLGAVPTGNSVVLSWPAAAGAAYYVLELSTDDFATVAHSTVAYGSSQTVDGLAAGSYKARVRAVNSRGGSASAWSTSFAAAAPPTSSLPATPAAHAGVVGDPFDVLATTGLAFTVSDPVAAAGSVTVTASSANTAVVPAGGLAVTRNGGDAVLRITPTGVGYADITLTLSNPQGATATRTLRYAASAHTAPSPQGGTRWFAGRADASTAILVDGGAALLVGDDEAPAQDGAGNALPGGNAFSLYAASTGGLPLQAMSFDAAALGLAGAGSCTTPGATGLAACSADAEVDVEASFALGKRIYVAGSHSNNRNGRSRPDRWRFFAVDVAGTGASTTLAHQGYYQWLREDLRSWDQAGGHALGANYLGLVASSDGGDGNPLKAPETDTLSGFSIEGMSTSPDDSQAWLGFRAPLVGAPGGPAVTADSATGRTHALIVPVTNFTALAGGTGGTKGTAQLGAPIRLDLGGRGIREIRKNGANQYLVIAGPSNSATGTAPRDFRLYSWDGSLGPDGQALNLRLRETALAGFTPPSLACAAEGIAELPADLDAGGSLRLVSDCGDAVFYGDGVAAKDLGFAAWKKFRADQLPLAALPTLGLAGAGTPGSTAAGFTARGSLAGGTLYAMVLPAAAPVPRWEQVVAGQDGSGAAAVWTTSLPAVAAPTSLQATGLAVGTAYRLYAVAVVPGGDSASVLAVQAFSTASAPLLLPQAIDFPQPADRLLGVAPFTLGATGGGSGQPVHIETLSADVCATGGAQGATVTLVAAGVCRLRATQAGGGGYAAAAPVPRSFTVGLPASAGTALQGGQGGQGHSASVAGNGWQFGANATGFGSTASLPGQPAPPPGYSLPFGVFGFALLQGTPGSSAALGWRLPQAAPAGAVLWKYGRTAGDPGAHWYQIPARFSVDRLTVSFSVTDGATGDDDLLANGVIVDPVALGVPVGNQVTAIPTLGEWARGLLALGLAGLAALGLRGQRPPRGSLR